MDRSSQHLRGVLRIGLGLWAVGLSVVGLSSAGCEATTALRDVPAPWEAREPGDAETPMTRPAALDEGPGWNRIGTSVRGKAIEAATLGSGPRKIYVIGGVQGDEPEGPVVAAGLPEALASVTELSTATIRVVRDMNPDGTAARSRGNTRGVDLNRNWPSRDFRKGAGGNRAPKSELETAVVLADMEKFKPDVVVVFHSSARGPQVTFEGPALMVARDFVSAARRVEPKWRLVPETRYHTPGSLESLVGRDWKKPVLVVEFFRGRDGDESVKAMRDALLAISTGVPAQSGEKRVTAAK